MMSLYTVLNDGTEVSLKRAYDEEERYVIISESIYADVPDKEEYFDTYEEAKERFIEIAEQ